MEYIYAALLLHKAGKKVDENGVKAVLTAAGVAADESRIKALIAALEGVNIEDAIKAAAVAPVAVAAAPAAARSSTRQGRAQGRAQEGRRRERHGRARCPVRLIFFLSFSPENRLFSEVICFISRFFTRARALPPFKKIVHAGSAGIGSYWSPAQGPSGTTAHAVKEESTEGRRRERHGRVNVENPAIFFSLFSAR